MNGRFANRAAALGLAAALTSACTKGPAKATPIDAAVAPSEVAAASGAPLTAAESRALRVAEDTRARGAISAEIAHDPRPVARRRAAQPLARLGQEEARGELLRALSDDDEETDAWGAYGRVDALRAPAPIETLAGLRDPAAPESPRLGEVRCAAAALLANPYTRRTVCVRRPPR